MTPEAIAIALRKLGIDSPPIEIFAEITSTNDLLWQRFQAGEAMPRVVIARQQTAGRGQWGLTWRSPLGGLYLSLLMPLALEPRQAYTLTLASVWGIAWYLRTADIPVQIKWANDLVLCDKKLGGIKTETKIVQDRISAAVIGVGINYANSVPDVGMSLQAFWQNDLKLSLAELAALVIAGSLKGVDRLHTESVSVMLKDYLQLLKNLGETIHYEGHQGDIVGVSDQGELMVRLSAPGASSTIKIPPGQISLGYGSQ